MAYMGWPGPGNLRQLLNANSKKKPKKQRKRRRKVAHKPPGSGALKMPPGIGY
jgi:hypothetical protein